MLSSLVAAGSATARPASPRVAPKLSAPSDLLDVQAKTGRNRTMATDKQDSTIAAVTSTAGATATAARDARQVDAPGTAGTAGKSGTAGASDRLAYLAKERAEHFDAVDYTRGVVEELGGYVDDLLEEFAAEVLEPTLQEFADELRTMDIDALYAAAAYSAELTAAGWSFDADDPWTGDLPSEPSGPVPGLTADMLPRRPTLVGNNARGGQGNGSGGVAGEALADSLRRRVKSVAAHVRDLFDYCDTLFRELVDEAGRGNRAFLSRELPKLALLADEADAAYGLWWAAARELYAHDPGALEADKDTLEFFAAFVSGAQ
jgi:hypothetical protein